MKVTRYVAIKEIECLPDDIKELHLDRSWRPWINCEEDESLENVGQLALNQFLRHSGLGVVPRTFHVFVKKDSASLECVVFTLVVRPCTSDKVGAIQLV